MDTIDEIGIAKDTIFIFTADNGPEALEANGTSLTVETAVHGSAGPWRGTLFTGFEGALPTVAGGLFPQPLIGVPISVGYGVAKGGHTALNSMLSSCANGLTVTNIDNGYGAAIAAYRILNQKSK